MLLIVETTEDYSSGTVCNSSLLLIELFSPAYIIDLLSASSISLVVHVSAYYVEDFIVREMLYLVDTSDLNQWWLPTIARDCYSKG